MPLWLKASAKFQSLKFIVYEIFSQFKTQNHKHLATNYNDSSLKQDISLINSLS